MHRKVLIAYFNAGNGHVACAKSIGQELQKNHPEIIVELMDMGEELRIKELSDVVIKQWKNILRMPQFLKNFIFFIEPITRTLTQIILWQYASRARFKMLRYLHHHKPDLVLSTHWASAMVVTKVKEKFNDFKNLKNYYLFTELAKAYGPMNCSADKYFGMSLEAIHSLRHLGIPHMRIFQVPMVIQNAMLENRDQQIERQALGLEVDKFTIVYTLGGEGIGPIKRYLFALRQLCPAVQVIVICGRNKVLFRTIKAWFPDIKNKAKILPLELVPNLGQAFAAADIVAGKCGTVTAMECISLKKPLIITMPGAPNEADNRDWLVKNKFAWYRPQALPFVQLIAKLSDPKNQEGQTILRERLKKLMDYEIATGASDLAQVIANDVK